MAESERLEARRGNSGRISFTDGFAMVAVSALFVAAAVLLFSSVAVQQKTYSQIIGRLSDGAEIQDYALVLAFARAMDFAVLKTSAVFMGFLLVLLGALYVLHAARSGYRLSVEMGGGSKLALHTASPGLVLVTLGVVVVLLSINSRSQIDYSADRLRADAAGSSLSAPKSGNSSIMESDVVAFARSNSQNKPPFTSTGAAARAPQSIGALGCNLDASPTVQLFKSGESDFSEEGREFLQSCVEYLNQNPNVGVSVEGEGDGPGSSREMDGGLGEQRSWAIKRFLEAKGVDRRRVQIVSFGESGGERLLAGKGAELKVREMPR